MIKYVLNPDPEAREYYEVEEPEPPDAVEEAFIRLNELADSLASNVMAKAGLKSYREMYKATSPEHFWAQWHDYKIINYSDTQNVSVEELVKQIIKRIERKKL